MKKREQGFAIVELVIIIAVVVAIGFVALKVMSVKKPAAPVGQTSQQSAQTTASNNVSWSFNGTDWQASGAAPACPAQPILKSPVDMSKVTAILYPGQVRGGNYKPHGGFHLAGTANNSVTVTIPLDATVTRGARYIEAGDVQYMFDFVNSCGVMYRFDHLLTLAPTFQKLADSLPEAKVDQSATTNFSTATAVKAGDTIATGVGHPATHNTSLDFGVYDLKVKNSVATAAYVQAHGAELAPHAVCWFDWLPKDDAAKIRSLPGADQAMGKTSDYCK